MRQFRISAFLSAAIVAWISGLQPLPCEAKAWPGFERGMGIGGWLTNYKRFNVLPEKRRLQITQGDLEHFDSYITETDVKRIKEWGFDHVRLGFDQIVLEESPGKYRERTFRKIDEFIGWCGRHKMNVVLNLHKAIGNYCDIKEEVELLDDEGLQRRFVVSICKEAGIPYCVWNYLSTPNDGNRFSLVDDDTREFLSDELLKVCLGIIQAP